MMAMHMGQITRKYGIHFPSLLQILDALVFSIVFLACPADCPRYLSRIIRVIVHVHVHVHVNVGAEQSLASR